MPNPISYFMHRSPWWFHRFETLVNHFIELVVPFFLLLGRRMCILHGLLQILFQVSCSCSASQGSRPLQCWASRLLRAVSGSGGRTGVQAPGNEGDSQPGIPECFPLLSVLCWRFGFCVAEKWQPRISAEGLILQLRQLWAILVIPSKVNLCRHLSCSEGILLSALIVQGLFFVSENGCAALHKHQTD